MSRRLYLLLLLLFLGVAPDAALADAAVDDAFFYGVFRGVAPA